MPDNCSLYRFRQIAAAICLAVVVGASTAELAPRAPQPPVDAPRIVRPGAQLPLTIRWIVEDGYYLDEKTRSSVEFRRLAGVTVTPARVETSSRVVGVHEQKASLSVSKDAAAGPLDLEADVVIFFCSVREQWCKRVARKLKIPLLVSPDGAEASSLEVELPVPADDER